MSQASGVLKSFNFVQATPDKSGFEY